MQVDCVFNIGVAGGVSNLLSVGDIVIGDKLVQHDFDITAFNHSKGYIPNVGTFIKCDDYLVYLAKMISNRLNYNVLRGTIASGDIFVGASRAALEAMSVGKPTIVCGNEGYIGIFDESKREISYKTNYCCRGCEDVSEELLIRDITALFDGGDLEKKGSYCREVILADFSAARTARDYERMYETLSPCPKTERGDILISGYYGFENAGDDSIAASIIHNIRKEAPDAKITIFCKNPKRNAKKYGVRAIGRFNIFAMLSEMRHAKLLISGGGNLLQNTTSSRSLFYYTAIIRLAKKLGLRIFVYANGVGPVFGKKYEKSIVKTLSLADRITFREPESIDYVASLGFDKSKITLSADPALTLCPAPK